MQQLRLVACASALFASVAAQSANGARIIEVLSDWGTAVTEGKIMGYPGVPNKWVESYQGPLLNFNGVAVQQSLNLAPGGLHSINAEAVPSAGGSGWSQLTTSVAVASGDYTSYGRAEAHFNVNFRVADEPVPFLAGANIENGTVDYNLFDVTAQSSVFNWHYSGSVFGYSNFVLTPNHTYWLSVSSRAEAQGTGAPVAQGIYDFDAVIMPEPSALLLLAGLAMPWLGRKRTA